MRIALFVLLAFCATVTQAEVATFDGNVGAVPLRVDEVEKIAKEIAAPAPRPENPELARVAGQCRLESSGKTIELKKFDPGTHYGLFLESPTSDIRIFAAGWDSGKIYLMISGEKISGAYATLPESAFRSGIPIDVGLTVPSRKPGDTSDEWLSCTVQLK